MGVLKLCDTDGKYIGAIQLQMYKCFAVLDEYIGHKYVTMNFIYTTVRHKAGQILPYDILISSYNNLSSFSQENAERAVDELFFQDEAEELDEYLARYYGVKLNRVRVALPLDGQVNWFFNQQYRCKASFLLEQPGKIYTLNFAVACSYDLRSCECDLCIKRMTARNNRIIAGNKLSFQTMAQYNKSKLSESNDIPF